MTTMNARLASLAVAVVLGALGVLLVATWQPSDPVLVLLALVTGVAALTPLVAHDIRQAERRGRNAR